MYVFLGNNQNWTEYAPVAVMIIFINEKSDVRIILEIHSPAHGFRIIGRMIAPS